MIAGSMALLLIAASDRAHWRRSDWKPADPKAVAASLAECERTAATASGAREKILAACMAKQGYFTWDGV